MTDAYINEIDLWLASGDHVSALEFHCFCSLLAKFARDYNLTSFCLVSHNSPYDTHSSKSDRYFLKQFIFKVLDLRTCTKSLQLNRLQQNLNTALWVVKPLLNKRGQLSFSLSLRTIGFIYLCDSDNYLCLCWGDFNNNSCITSRSKGALEEFVELSIENSICDKLPFLWNAFLSFHAVKIFDSKWYL